MPFQDRRVSGSVYPLVEQHQREQRAGWEGRWLTDGRVDISTFKAVKSSNARFTRAVLDALPAMRFTPAASGGARVNQLIQQPFVFQLAK